MEAFEWLMSECPRSHLRLEFISGVLSDNTAEAW